MAINPYQSVIPGTEGNPLPNQYQNILPGTTGNVYNPTNVPIPETKTVSSDIIGTQPVRFPQAPTPEVSVMPQPIQRVNGGSTQINADGTTTGVTPPLPTSAAPTETETTQTGLMSRFTALQEKLFGKAPAQAQAEITQGIPEKTKVYNDIQAQINQLQNEANAAVIKAQTAGETTSFGNAQIAQIERDRTVKALQLNSFLYAAQGNLATAQMMADKAVAAEFSPAEAEIGYIKDFLDINEKVLTREDKKKADALKIQLDERTRIIEEQKAEKKAINSIAIEAAQAGADASLLNKIQNATSQQEALQIASSDPMLFQWAAKKQREAVELDLKYKEAQIANVYSQMTPPANQPEVIADRQGNTLKYGTPEYLIERLKQTAGSKTKPVASEREHLGKFSNVVALTDNLMNSLSKTMNDPIIGYLRSLNPYDFDARAVNAQVTALVPSVARALYGEVGVLTDTDIERYLKTLPNIKSTADQNKFIASMTLSNARRAYEQTLLNLASSNVNVSGFTDSYKNLVSKLDKLNSDIGGQIEVGEADLNEFNSVVSQPEGYWSNLWGAITGK